MYYYELEDDIDFLCGSTSASYPTADKLRNVNIAYQDIARLIWSSTGEWSYDDSNATDLPIAATNLVHNQQDYALPSTAQRIQRVEVKDIGGDYRKLDQIDIQDVAIAMPEFQETAGLPIYYDLIGNSIMLYPIPSSAYTTLTSGMQVYFDRTITELTGGSAQIPGFATPFHRILSYAAALDFTTNPQQRQFLMTQRQKLEQGLINFYAKRNIEEHPQIKPLMRKYSNQYK